MYEVAKKAREKMKAKARSLASEKDQKVDSSDWSPAEPLNTEAKTGMRPISPRNFKKGGKVVGKAAGAAAKSRADRPGRKSGGRVETEIGVGMANKNMKEANQSRPGVKHIGGLKKGGKVARATGGNVPSDKETQTNKDRIGTEKIKPVRGAAQNYKKGGKACGGYADGGQLPSPDEALGSEVRMKGLKVMPSQANTSEAQVTPSQLKREEGYTRADMKAKRMCGGRTKKMDGGVMAPVVPRGRLSFGQNVVTPGLKKGGKADGGEKWIQKAIKKPGALHKQLGVPEGEKIPAKKLHAAAEKGGKLGKRARLAETLGRMNRATGGRAKKGKTDINIVIATGRGQQPDAGAMPPPGILPARPAVPVPVPPPAPAGIPMGAGAPPMPVPPPGAMPPGMPIGRKAGGRITKVAKSYKDMEAGAASGEGRLQKTDIAKLHKDAPARKRGGKVYRSYKDMDAGAASGEGRLEKTEIEKSQRTRGK